MVIFRGHPIFYDKQFRCYRIGASLALFDTFQPENGSSGGLISIHYTKH